MYPELFRIGNFSVSTFGVMLAIAFLVGTRICAIRLGEQGEDPEQAWNLLLWMMLGGIFGSKLYFAVDVALRAWEGGAAPDGAYRVRIALTDGQGKPLGQTQRGVAAPTKGILAT